jgi:hypothetical protein
VPVKPRSWVRLDRFAVFDVARDLRLSAAEAWLLTTVVLLADWRTHECTRSLTDLAERARLNRRTTSAAVQRLTDEGLVTQLEPFGPNRTGVLWVDCYDRLVLPNPATARNRANEQPANRARRAPEASANRAASALNCADVGAMTRCDATARGSEEARMSSLRDRARDNGANGGYDHAVETLQHEAGAVIEVGHERCSSCNERANGEPGPRGEPYCRECEVF